MSNCRLVLKTTRLCRWLRFKHKTRRSKGGSYPLSHLYETLGLVRKMQRPSCFQIAPRRSARQYNRLVR
jgi:hypothetical protein